MNCWVEQIWYAAYMIGKCYEHQEEWEPMFTAYVKAFEERPHRNEPVVPLMKYCRDQKWYRTAWMFGLAANKNPYPREDSLFIENGCYSFLILHELSILAYYLNEVETGLKISNRLLLTHHRRDGMGDGELQSVQRNMEFYVKNLPGVKHTELKSDKAMTGWNFMNPSIVRHNGEIFINLRAVNYVVNEQLQYSLNGKPNTSIDEQNPITTMNFHVTWDEEKQQIIQESLMEIEFFDEHLLHNPKICVGYEDVRIFEFQNVTWFCATTQQLSSDNINTIVLGTRKGDRLFLMKSPIPGRCEKNWSCMEHKGKLLIIYQYSPFEIFEVNPETGEYRTFLKKKYDDLDLSSFRGGSCPVKDPVLGGYSFVIHEVLPHYSVTRHYCTRFVHLNDDLEITHISPQFHCNGKEPIEYVSGMIFSGDQCCFTWGELDGKAFLSSIPADSLFKDEDRIENLARLDVHLDGS